MTTLTDEGRQEFEAAMLTHFNGEIADFWLDRLDDGRYEFMRMEDVWLGWRLRASLVRQESASQEERMDATTFDELVEYGRAHGANIVKGMPWSFTFDGKPVSHENDDCYLIGNERFERGDLYYDGRVWMNPADAPSTPAAPPAADLVDGPTAAKSAPPADCNCGEQVSGVHQASCPAGEPIVLSAPPAEGQDRAAIVAALSVYQQADDDGVMVLVSRQACDEAVILIEQLTRENRELIHDNARMMERETQRLNESRASAERGAVPVAYTEHEARHLLRNPPQADVVAALVKAADAMRDDANEWRRVARLDATYFRLCAYDKARLEYKP